MWQAAHCTLYTEQCTLHTALVPAVCTCTYTLHTTHWKLHTAHHVICKFITSHCKHKKICLSWSQDLDGKMCLDITQIVVQSSMYTGIGHFKSWRICKLNHCFKNYGVFFGYGGFCLVVEFHWEGSAINRATPSGFDWKPSAE